MLALRGSHQRIAKLNNIVEHQTALIERLRPREGEVFEQAKKLLSNYSRLRTTCLRAAFARSEAIHECRKARWWSS